MAEANLFKLTLHPSHPSVTVATGNGIPWGSAAGGEGQTRSLGGIRTGGGRFRAVRLLCCSQGPSGSDHCAVCSFHWRKPGRAVATQLQSSQPRPSPVGQLFAHLAAADLLVILMVMPLDATWNVAVQ